MKRGTENITLGSGKIYVMAYTDTMPTVDAICVDENLLGHIKGGAELSYTEETYEEKDDLGLVSKIITTSEEAILKCGLLTWNGDTMKKLVDRAKVTTESGKRITKIGGFGNAQGGYYAICFFHEDKTISIELHIVVENGVNIPAVCEAIINQVRYLVSSYTGVQVANVEVFVDSMTF